MSVLSIQNNSPRPILSERRVPCSLLNTLTRVLTIAAAFFAGLPNTFASCPEASSCRIPESATAYIGETRIQGAPRPIAFPEIYGNVHPGHLFFKGDQEVQAISYKLSEIDFRETHEKQIQSFARLYTYLTYIEPSRNTLAEFQNKEQGDNAFVLGIKTTSEDDQRFIAYRKTALIDFQNAAGYLESWMENLQHLSNEQIAEELSKTNQIITFGKAEGNQGYRTKDAIVWNESDSWANSQKTLHQRVWNAGGTKEQRKIAVDLDRSLKAKKADFKAFTEEQRKVIRLVGHIPPFASDIPFVLHTFIREMREMDLQMRECEDFDPVGFAAYVHQQIGKIQPFNQSNGRLARLLMNFILRKAGYQPVIFPDLEKHRNAVRQDDETPGSFTKYLQDVIAWNEEQFDPNKDCLTGLTCPEIPFQMRSS